MFNFKQMHFDMGGNWQRCFFSISGGKTKSDIFTEPKHLLTETIILFVSYLDA